MRLHYSREVFSVQHLVIYNCTMANSPNFMLRLFRGKARSSIRPELTGSERVFYATFGKDTVD